VRDAVRAAQAVGIVTNAVVAGAGLALALAVKALYSGAGADELLWILAPSVWLARVVGGVDLTYEPGAGFISHTRHLVVGPACAGVNFLIVAFVALQLAFVGRFVRVRTKLAWVVGALGLAYGATISTNGARIAIAARLYELDVYGGAVTPDRVHRLAGTILYYGSLLALFVAVESVLGTRTRRIVPLACYLLVALGVPLAGRAWQHGAGRFVEHAAWVVGVAVLLTAIAALPALRRDRVKWKTP
jgi:exosortase K